MKIKKHSKRPVRAARSGGAGREVLSNGWVIQKIGNRWYLLSKDEFSKYEDHLSDYPKDLMTDSFPTKVSLIQQFLKEPAYKGMFEKSGYSLDENWGVVRSSLNSSVRASRASRVMAAKRSIHFLVTITDTDEIIDVLEDQDEAIEVARKYTQKYGDSATVEKEWIGSDGEVYDSTVCFQTDGDFNSSTKITKRPIKASRPIMAGAGAGITLKLADLTFTEVPNSGFYNEYNEYHDFLEPENGACKGTIEIESIGTYYDGGNPNTGVIPVSIFVEEVTPYDAEDAQQMMSGTLKDVIDEFDEFEPTIRIGGGWTRVTFDGTFEVEGYSGYSALKLKVEIEDKDMVRWLDLFAHGEAGELYYDICINGNPMGNYYYSQEDAIATAKEYAADPDYADDEITVETRHYATDYMGDIMYDYDDDGDVVWSSEDDLYE